VNIKTRAEHLSSVSDVLLHVIGCPAYIGCVLYVVIGCF